jgi:hypothetical protein
VNLAGVCPAPCTATGDAYLLDGPLSQARRVLPPPGPVHPAAALVVPRVGPFW